MDEEEGREDGDDAMQGKKIKANCSPPPIDGTHCDACVYQPSTNNWPRHDYYESVDAFGALERRREMSAHAEVDHNSCSMANGLTQAVNPSLDETKDIKPRKQM